MLKKGQRRQKINFSKNSRGLSEVVTTLIIVLLVLVAIGIVWVVVNNLLQEGSGEVEIGQFTLDIQIESVRVQDGEVIVVVKRNSGKGDFIGINFIFSDNQSSEIIRQNTTFDEFQKKSFTFTLSEIDLTKLKTVSIAPIFKLSSGKEKIGNLGDSFDVHENKSLGGEQNDNPPQITGKFVELGFSGAEKVEYIVTSSPDIYPEFKSVIIDPLDVHIGDNQIFTAVVYSPYDVVSVIATTQLDNEVLTLSLAKISENAGTSTWTANWKVYDTHINTYRTTFTAIDNKGNENSVGLTWTDACTDQFVHGLPSTISVNCSIGADTITGADTSNIFLASGVTITLNQNSILAYTPGNAFSIDGTILKNGTGSMITKQYLFYYDADNDRHSANTTYFLSTTGTNASGRVRPIYLLGSASDDCDGTNANVYTGQTSYFTTHRGDGSYDYNCDSVDSKDTSGYGITTNPNGYVCEYNAITEVCRLIIESSSFFFGWVSSQPACGVGGSYLDAAQYDCSVWNGDEFMCIETPGFIWRTVGCR
jgi:hypothetical protein